MNRMLIKAIVITVMINVRGNTVYGQDSSTESSSEYLRNVMTQLQEHNKPAANSLSDRTTFNGDFSLGDRQHFVLDNELFAPRPSDSDQYYREYLHTVNKPDKTPLIHSTDASEEPVEPPLRYYEHQPAPIVPGPVSIVEPHVKYVEPHVNYVEPHVNYVEPQVHYAEAPVKIIPSPMKLVKPPEPLGLTRAELAALYEDALHRGSTINMPRFPPAVATRGHPSIVGNQLQLSPHQREYYYYFYPLKTFMSHLHGYNGPQPIPIDDDKPDPIRETEKGLANPLFMAISSFVGVAMLFMATVLFLPKFGKFRGRGYTDEFLELTRIAGEAIEGKNCSARFACELEKAEESLNLSNQTARIFRSVMPGSIREQMRRFDDSKKRGTECRRISCKET